MAHETEKILIFGATGLIGRHIRDAIVENATAFGRIGIFTSPHTVQTKSKELDALKSKGIEVIAGDITSADNVNDAYSGFDTIVSCIGRPVIHLQLLLVRLAEKHVDV